MKNCFYGSFVPGTREIIAAVVRERLPGVSIIQLLDGAVIFETECSYDRLNFFCFNNIFAVIDIRNTGSRSPAEALNSQMKKIAEGDIAALPERARAVISENNKKIKTFRLVCSVENKPASINESAKRDIENFIARNSTLKPDRANPDTEFWFLYRSEGFSLFMKRLTRSVEKKLYPGELSPQLAWLLCRAGGLKSGESALDPFCGYGAIPEAALKHFPVKKILAFDIDPRCVKITRERRALKSERFEIFQADAFTALNSFPEGGADIIITDPPWGMYRETNIPLGKFYEKMLVLFSKVLKPGGRAVILTGARDEFEAAVKKTPALVPGETMPVLVSGKKAAVYVLELFDNIARGSESDSQPRVKSPL